jgi:hypothetical protein
MNSDIQSFLEDLYEIDPALREHEEELIPLLVKLLKVNPGREPSPEFIEELRRQLHSRADALRTATYHSPLPMTKFFYALTGAIAAIIFAVPATYYGTKNVLNSSSTDSKNALFSYSISEAGTEAFGPLSTFSTAGTAGGLGGGGNAISARPQSGGGGGGIASPAMSEQSDAYGVTPDAKMIAPNFYTEYNYVYSGSLPTLPEGNVSVLKRQNNSNRPSISSVANIFNLGSMDLQSFQESKLDSISFSQDTQFGYMINVQLRDGQVMVNQNWEKWPHPENDCRDDACYRRYQTKIEDIPADSELIAIANKFLEEHGVDLSAYGTPEVDKMWKRDYDRMADKSQAYVPESQQVVYPLMIDGRAVYDMSGTKVGIRAGVSVKHKRISELWGIQNQQFTRSNYEAVSGSGDIMKFLSNFERMNMDYLPKDAKKKIVKVELGEPVLGFSSYFNYTKSVPEEIIAPSLIFPVKNVEGDEYFWRQSVVVPLAKELINQNSPQPMPIDTIRAE